MKLLLLIFLALSLPLAAQNNYYLIDTAGIPLQKLSEDDQKLLQQNLELFHNAKNDTIKIKALMALADGLNNDLLWPLYNRFAYNLASEFLKKPSQYNAQELKIIKSNLASATGNIGFSLINKGEMAIAHYYFEEALLLSEAINSKEQIASALNNIGYIYEQQGNIPEALQRYHRSVKIKEEIGDKAGIARTLNNIAVIHKNIEEDFEVALPYFKKCEKIFNELGDNNGLGYALNNIGDIYLQKNYKDEALTCFEKCYQLFRQTGNERGMFFSLMNIGRVQHAEENYEGALQSFTKAKEQNKSINDKEGLCQVLTRLSETCFQLNQKEVAKQYGSSAYRVATELGVPDHISNAAKILSAIYSSEKNWEQALYMKNIHVAMKDSIHNESNKKRTYQQLLKYQFGKKEQQMELEKEKQDVVNALEKKRKNFVILFVSAGMVILLVFLLFVFNRYRIIRQQKKVIERQKQVVDNQQQLLLVKNKELEHKTVLVTDSINYASRIQNALLPSEGRFKEVFSDTFIFFQPKDIVSGDFYWGTQIKNKALFAVVDCTGHGVPGAFMSLIGSNLLDKIVSELNITEPNLVLDQLHLELHHRLHQNQSSDLKDGMDMVFCSIDLDTLQMELSGANNPVYIISGNSLREIKTDRYFLGDVKLMKDKKFSKHTIQLNKNDIIYLFSDGYSDQKGGQENQKFYSSRFKALLQNIHGESMEKQKELLATTINHWKGNEKQVDDMLVLGVKL